MTDHPAELHERARRLRDLVEPIAASVYFSPEAQSRYEALGLNYFEGYFCSRSACLGAAPWRVVVAAFAAFKPAVVERAVTGGWEKTTPAALLRARLDGAREQVERMAGDHAASFPDAADRLLVLTDGVDPSGRPLFAGLAGLPVPGPDDPAGRLFRAADLVREHRGDGHIAAWIGELDSVEVTVMSEPWWGIEPGSYAWTRGWDPDDVAAARARLVDRGLIDGDGALTPAGAELRDRIERTTDHAARVVVERLGHGADDLFDLLAPIAEAMTGQGGYPESRANLFG